MENTEQVQSVRLEATQGQNEGKKLESSTSDSLFRKSQEVAPLVTHDVDPLVAKKKKKSKSPKRVHAPPTKDRKKEILGAYLSSTDFSKLRFSQINNSPLEAHSSKIKSPVKSIKLNFNGSRSAAVSPKRQEDEEENVDFQKSPSPVQTKKPKEKIKKVAAASKLEDKLTKKSPYAVATSKFIL